MTKKQKKILKKTVTLFTMKVGGVLELSLMLKIYQFCSACTTFEKSKVGGVSELKISKLILYFSQLALPLHIHKKIRNDL